MKYVFDTTKIVKENLTLSEFFITLGLRNNPNLKDIIQALIEKEVLIEISDDKYAVTYGWSDRIDNVLLDSDKSIPTSSGIEHLAEKLMNIFPKGKKEGTQYYWKGSKKDIILKLRKFFKLYGNKYTYDKIEEATKRYVESFNGDYRYMRILKYFIYKSVRKVNEEGVGYVEDVSQLAEYLENTDDVDNSNSWNNELLN